MIEIEDSEKFADEVDRASSIERALTEEGVRKVLDSIERAPSDFDGISCVTCGEEIHQARLKHGFFRCAYCQGVLEKRRKQNHAR